MSFFPAKEDEVRHMLGGTLTELLAREERQIIDRAIILCDGNKAAAAGALGIARETLFKKLRRKR